MGVRRGAECGRMAKPKAIKPHRDRWEEGYAALTQITTKNVGKLKVLCTYDTDEFTAFESSLIMVENALIGTTEYDIFSLNPATCAENWRTHLDYPGSLLPANRGVAYMDACCFVAPRTLGYWPLISRPASNCGRRESGTRNVARRPH